MSSSCARCDSPLPPGSTRCSRCGAKADLVKNSGLAAMVVGPTGSVEEAEPEAVSPAVRHDDHQYQAPGATLDSTDAPVVSQAEKPPAPTPIVDRPLDAEPVVVEPGRESLPVDAEPAVATNADDTDSASTNSPLSGIDLVEQLAIGSRRHDLLERISAAKTELQTAHARVVVVGEYKQGKSSLVNALLGTEVCPVDGVRATTVPTVVRYGETLSASWIGLDEKARPLGDGDLGTEVALRRAVLEGTEDRPTDLTAIEVRVPRRLLAAGLMLVDTPGVGGLSSPEAVVAAAMAKQADAVLFVSDLTQELTAPELAHLQSLAQESPNIICVFTKVDLTTSGTEIVARNRVHLDAAGLAHLPHVVVSSALHAFALEQGDLELEAESGFEQLFDLLKRRGLESAKTRVATSARAELEFVSSQLELEAHATARAAAGEAAQVATELGEAKERVVLSRSDQAAWRKELALGMKRLQGDAQFDRQKRRLAINQWIDNFLADEGDDSTVEADDFIDAMHSKVVEASVGHFDEVQDSIDQLTAKVRSLYEAESADGLVVHLENEFRPSVDHLPPIRTSPSMSRTRNLLAVAQSSSSGMMIARGTLGLSTTGLTTAGLVGTAGATGVALALGPLLLGAPIGVLLAMRAVRDDRKRNRDATAHELRKQANTYVQGAWLEFEHESRRAIDEAQSLLREAVESRSRQVEQTLVHAARAAERVGRARDAGAVGDQLESEIGKGRDALEAMRTQPPTAMKGTR